MFLFKIILFFSIFIFVRKIIIKKQSQKLKEYLISFINGFCMSLADSVPGVSGGTVAFILGFYDKFIMSLDDLFRGNIAKKKEAFKYLFKIFKACFFVTENGIIANGLNPSCSLLSNAIARPQ